MENNLLWFWLTNIPSVGPVRLRKLFQYFDTAEQIYYASEKQLSNVVGLGVKSIQAILASRDLDKIKRCYDKLEQRGIYFVAKNEKKYPKKLLQNYDAPFGIYVRGKLPSEDMKTIAVVGARDCSTYGLELARYFARELSLAGIQIISGMARGVDSASHRGALEVDRDTYAVLGSGIDVCYPPEHFNLYEEIKTHGGIISEYGLGVNAASMHFPMRNRIISGMSDGILVVEARKKSGSLITADLGLEQGKDIFAIPGRVGDELSYGCNKLIKMGAYMVQSPNDILECYDMGKKDYEKDLKKNNNMLDSKEKIVYANLSFIPKHLNEILGETNMELCELMESLVALEIKGYIKQTMKNYYIVSND